ncbi:MAG: GNAT family N-acetyltransferase [Candidatus Gastranaerophilaceae bacterium]|nr:acetyltransferase [Clostridium sp. CAG:967]
MKKDEIKIDGLYQIKKKDLRRCAEVAAKAFLDDESSKFLFSSKLTYKSLYNYYLVIYNAAFRKMYMFAESEDINGFIIITPVKNSNLSVWDCLSAGALKIIFSQGLGIVFRSLEYEKNCNKTREGIASSDSWYIFQFGVLPDKQGMKLGSKIIKPVLRWFDEEKIPCYLETQKDVNVCIYNHLGFLLKMIGTLPDKKMSQFAMFRNSQ